MLRRVLRPGSVTQADRRLPRLFCVRGGCGCVARWRARDTAAVYCPNHAADLAPYIVMFPIEGFLHEQAISAAAS